MNFITEDEAKTHPKRKMDSIFVTDADGRLYELPGPIAQKLAVGEARMKDLGHSPILPYDTLESRDASDEVGGRHMAPALIGSGMIWHERWLIGPYCWWQDRQWYFGPHCHPWKNYLAHDREDL